MVESISYLNIRPIYQYRGNKNGDGRTTITSFDELLKDEVEQVAAGNTEKEQAQEVSQDTAAKEQVQTVSQDAAANEQAQTVSQDTAANEQGSETAVSLYKDPTTGQAVQYIDVANEAKKTTQTTSASDMKTTKYDAYFKEASEKYGVSESLLKGIAKAESNFNPNDVSSAGAIGIMQLMPGTAKEFGVTDPYDPRQNILGGAQCIASKLKEFNGDIRLALAAYNAGSGAVKRNGGVPSYCTKYVNKVISYKEAFETAEAVG